MEVRGEYSNDHPFIPFCYRLCETPDVFAHESAGIAMVQLDWSPATKHLVWVKIDPDDRLFYDEKSGLIDHRCAGNITTLDEAVAEETWFRLIERRGGDWDWNQHMREVAGTVLLVLRKKIREEGPSCSTYGIHGLVQPSGTFEGTSSPSIESETPKPARKISKKELN